MSDETVLDHNTLYNREAEDSHPIEAITGFEEISNTELLRMWIEANPAQ